MKKLILLFFISIILVYGESLYTQFKNTYRCTKYKKIVDDYVDGKTNKDTYYDYYLKTYTRMFV